MIISQTQEKENLHCTLDCKMQFKSVPEKENLPVPQSDVIDLSIKKSLPDVKQINTKDNTNSILEASKGLL